MSLLFLCAMSTVMWLTPSLASACSCFVQEALLWPQEGELAEDEALLLQYQGESPEDACGGALLSGGLHEHQAFVDGQAVDLVPLEDRPGYVLEPMPAPGAVVTVARCTPGEVCDSDQLGPEDRWELTVVQATGAGPGEPTLADIGHETVEFDDCGEMVHARDWTVVVTPDSGEPRLHEIVLGPAGTGARRFVFTAASEPFEATIRRTEEDAGETVCATVRSYDMAGNQSGEVSSCSALDQDETLGRGGCSCRAGPSPRRGAAGSFLALAMLMAARRRGQRQRSRRRDQFGSA